MTPDALTDTLFLYYGGMAFFFLSLIAWIYWLIKQIEKKEEIIKEQNEYIRTSDKESLSTAKDVVSVMDKLLEDGKRFNRETIEAIKQQAQQTQERIINHIKYTQGGDKST